MNTEPNMLCECTQGDVFRVLQYSSSVSTPQVLPWLIENHLRRQKMSQDSKRVREPSAELIAKRRGRHSTVRPAICVCAPPQAGVNVNGQYFTPPVPHEGVVVCMCRAALAIGRPGVDEFLRETTVNCAEETFDFFGIPALNTIVMSYAASPVVVKCYVSGMDIRVGPINASLDDQVRHVLRVFEGTQKAKGMPPMRLRLPGHSRALGHHTPLGHLVCSTRDVTNLDYWTTQGASCTICELQLECAWRHY